MDGAWYSSAMFLFSLEELGVTESIPCPFRVVWVIVFRVLKNGLFGGCGFFSYTMFPLKGGGMVW